MHLNFIGNRIEHVLSDANSNWMRDCNSLQADMGKKGQFGGSVSLSKAMVAFDNRLRDASAQLLDEMANAIDTRGLKWRRAHELLLSKIDTNFEGTSDKARNMMTRGGGDYEFADAMFSLSISAVKADISAHSIGWTAPKAERWSQRHPFLYFLITAASGVAIGLAAAPTANFLGLSSTGTMASTEH